MAFHYSKPFEALLGHEPGTGRASTVRVLIVGSGYGGAVAAWRLAGRANRDRPARDHEVLVLERGAEYLPGEFPSSLQDVAAFIGMQQAGRPDTIGDDSLFSLRRGTGVDVLVGHGLGGTSLINANVAVQPRAAAFLQPEWPAAIRSEAADFAHSTLGQAFEAVRRCLDVTDERNDAELKRLAKYQAFAHYADSLGFPVAPAPIAVTLGDQPRRNHLGVLQPACTRCGNCVSGCNVGAKNTLAMNLIPAAHARGARFYTGALVMTVRPLDSAASGGPCWRVTARPASGATRARLACSDIHIDADIVILAAGTLGSTEILQRSQTHQPLFSSQLGRHFSTNGDALASSFAEREPVAAIGAVDYRAAHATGPTITALAEGVTATGQRFTLEDGAVPAAIAPLIGELLTTAAQLQRLGNNQLPAWFRRGQGGAGLDPIDVHDEALRRGQIFLVMGEDGSHGELTFNAEGDGATEPVWPAKDREHTETWRADLARINATLSSQDRRFGLKGGQFVPNPAFQPLPQAAMGVASGSQTMGGRLVTVHPLGGCRMADSGAGGVVNHVGAVFQRDSAAVWEGLHVLDGAVVPTALGINPFLTIAALAWRACDSIGAALGPEAPLPPPSAVRQLPVNQHQPRAANAADYPIVVRERLIGALDAASVSGAANARSQLQLSLHALNVQRWFEYDGLVLQLETAVGDARKLLVGGEPVKLAARLYQNPARCDDARRVREHHVEDAGLTADSLIAAGEGHLTIMTANRPAHGFALLGRAVSVARAFFKYRQSLALLLKDSKPGKRWQFLRASVNLALMHTTFRDFNYAMELQVPAAKTRQPTHLRIHGTKRVSWQADAPRLWEALLALPATVEISNGSGNGLAVLRTSATLNVDTTYLLGSGLVKFEPTVDNHSPLGAFNVFAFVTRFARSILQASFWEFGAPDYPKTISDAYRPDRHLPQQLPVKSPGGALLQSATLRVPDRRAEKSRGLLPLLMSCYRHSPGPAPRGPVLLIHGLAQGSKIYAHPLMGARSMAAFLFDQGYDVWLYDFRLSNIFDRETVPYGRWTIDDIAEFDIPAGVQHVLNVYRSEGGAAATRLHIFAHCVGAIATEMAILKGWVTRGQIASVALNAIHPWTMASPANRARASALGPLRDALDDAFFNPVIETDDKVSATHTLIDRLASSIARLGESDPRHPQVDSAAFANAICDRMTLMYGRMWRHDKTQAVHPRWIDLVGSSPAPVQRQLYYLLLNSRLANHWGENVYLTQDNLERHWRGIRTFFVHGDLSDVFNAESATRSANNLHYALNLRAHGKAARTPVLLKRFTGFGHMDVILSDEAANDGSVFPLLHQFFSGVLDGKVLDPIANDRERAHGDADPALRAGPVLRGARIDHGRLQLRVWGQLPDQDTVTPTGMQVANAEDSVDVSPAFDDRPGDNLVASAFYRWLDVTMDAAQFAPLEAKATFRNGGKPPSLPASTVGSVAAMPTATVTTASMAATVPLPWLRRLQERAAGRPARDAHFIVGSCRYPGLMVDREQPDAIFAGMLRLLRGETGLDCDLVFLIGDQIYADATAGLADPKLWRDRYLDRYREAIGGPQAREVFRSIPIHFAIDDHEIADNFSGCIDTRPAYWNRLPWHVEAEEQGIVSGEVTTAELDFALRAAHSYVGSQRDTRPFGGAQRPAGRFWYALDHVSEARFPSFITDTRSERQRASATAPARLMSPEQLAALLGWLRDVAALDVPKFIFSGSVIAPLTRDAFAPGALLREDGLAAYPRELEPIVALIVELNIRHVVFIGGDLHISATAALDLVRQRDGHSVRALQIVSSGLYAPLPFINTTRDSIDWKGSPDARRRIPLGGHAIEYSPELLTDANSHFVHVAAAACHEGWCVSARALDRAATQVAPQHCHII